MSTVVEPARRSRQDWAELADEIIPKLQSGEITFAEAKERYNIGHVYALRVEMARKGSDLQGQPLEVKPMTAKRPAAIAKELAKGRKRGEPFWLLEVRSGMNYNTMQKTLRENGFPELATGRNSQNGTDS